MTTHVVDDWLREAERIRFPSRVRGASVVVIVARQIYGRWRVAIHTGAPGHRTYAGELRRECANRWNAIMCGLQSIRDYWITQDVPSLAAEVQELIEEAW